MFKDLATTLKRGGVSKTHNMRQAIKPSIPQNLYKTDFNSDLFTICGSIGNNSKLISIRRLRAQHVKNRLKRWIIFCSSSLLGILHFNVVLTIDIVLTNFCHSMCAWSVGERIVLHGKFETLILRLICECQSIRISNFPKFTIRFNFLFFIYSDSSSTIIIPRDILTPRTVGSAVTAFRCQFHQRSTSSFYACRSQKRKKDCRVKQLFVLSGSASVKGAHRMLMKLTAGLTS